MKINKKRGLWSTELWVSVSAALIPIANSHFGWKIPSEQVISILTVLLGYIFSRTRLKEKSIIGE